MGRGQGRWWWKPEWRTGIWAERMKKEKRGKKKEKKIGERITISSLIWMQLVFCPGPRFTPVWKLPLCYHSGNVVACEEMERRGKTGRMQIACRCWDRIEWQMSCFRRLYSNPVWVKWPRLSKALTPCLSSLRLPLCESLLLFFFLTVSEFLIFSWFQIVFPPSFQPSVAPFAGTVFKMKSNKSTCFKPRHDVFGIRGVAIATGQ